MLDFDSKHWDFWTEIIIERSLSEKKTKLRPHLKKGKIRNQWYHIKYKIYFLWIASSGGKGGNANEHSELFFQNYYLPNCFI